MILHLTVNLWKRKWVGIEGDGSFLVSLSFWACPSQSDWNNWAKQWYSERIAFLTKPGWMNQAPAFQTSEENIYQALQKSPLPTALGRGQGSSAEEQAASPQFLSIISDLLSHTFFFTSRAIWTQAWQDSLSLHLSRVQNWSRNLSVQLTLGSTHDVHRPQRGHRRPQRSPDNR